MKIGLVPGSFKPYHKGHDELVRLASSENDLVLVFNSDADRDVIRGQDVIKIMNKFVKPSLPKNVKMISVGVPVGALYQELEYAEQSASEDTYTIYSDSEDIKKYNKNVLTKYAPNLMSKNQILTRPVQRGVETTDVSGTEMRKYLTTGNVQKFAELLPPAIQRHSKEIIDILTQKIKENLLISYIKEIIKG